MKIILQRIKEDAYGTHGKLIDQDQNLLCYTLEPQWKDNQENISCIFPGIYDCSPHNTDKHPHCWQLNNVQGRTGVLIHEGNFVENTEGCIIVGLEEIRNGVLKSQLALQKLRGILPDNFQLEILAIQVTIDS